MILVWLLGLITIILSGSAEFFSVYGLAQVFSGAFLPTIIMGAALGAAKLTIASFLYTHWKRINLLFKSALMVMIFGLMGLTSFGIFGFLSSAYQTDSVDLKVVDQQVSQLDEEKKGYENRLTNIDEQIKNVPDTKVRQKIQLINSLKVEKQDILSKLDTVTHKRDDLASSKVKTEVKTGPITFVAKAIGKSIDSTVTYLILLIMLLLDPSAVALTIATNMAIRYRKEDKQAVIEANEPTQSTKTPVSSIPETEKNLDEFREKLDSVVDTLDKSKKKNEILNSIRSQD